MEKLLIFDLDKVLIDVDSSEYDFDFGTGQATHRITKDTVDIVTLGDYSLLQYLRRLKIEKNYTIAIISKTDQCHLEKIVNNFFRRDIIDFILGNDNSYTFSQTLNPDLETRFRIEGGDNESTTYYTSDDTETRNLTLRIVQSRFRDIYIFNMHYFTNSLELVKDSEKLIKYVKYCPKVLTRSILEEYLNKHEKWDQGIDVAVNFLERSIPDDRYLKQYDVYELLDFVKFICCKRKFIDDLFERWDYKVDLGGDEESIIKKPDIKSILDENNFTLMVSYFKYIQQFIEDHGKNSIYSLGDSLDKYTFVWNDMININESDNHIIRVPFSGSMYMNIGYTDRIEIDSTDRDAMFTNLDELLENNNDFKKMYDKIYSGHHVLITDYGHSGKGPITIVNLLKYKNPNIDLNNVHYLLVTDSSKEIERNILKHAGELNGLNRIYYNELLSMYYTNSDKVEGRMSRCISRYSVDLWDRPPDPVWKDNLADNYRQCNLHRVFLLIILCCFVNNYIGGKFNDATFNLDNKGDHSILTLSREIKLNEIYDYESQIENTEIPDFTRQDPVLFGATEATSAIGSRVEVEEILEEIDD
jgi:hypothetical protein